MRTIITALFCSLLAICTLLDNSQACTTFCLNTPHGPVFGSNLDLLIPGDGLVFINQRGIAKKGLNTTGGIAKWVSKYGSVTFNLAGREFAFGGMNEAGLVVGSMELRNSEFSEIYVIAMESRSR
jgi:choloylglycine hydrolase